MSNTPKFKAGQIVWVKCGSLFWPGEVQSLEKLPKDIKEEFDEGNAPKVIVKFFDEDGYEFLNDYKNIFDYNCDRKEEFIKKGIVKSRTKQKEGATSGWFAKFPNDIVLSEKKTGGDVNILEKDPYVEKNEKVNYKDIFGGPPEAKKASPKKRGETGRKRKPEASPKESPKKSKKASVATPQRPITHPRFNKKAATPVADHKVKILPQPSTPYHLDLQMKQEKTTPAGSYTCHICGFSATRLNVIILHNKSHSESTTPAKKTAASSTPTAKKRGRASETKSSTTPVAKAPQKRESTASPAPKKKETAKKVPAAKTPATPKQPAKAQTPKEKKPRMTKKAKEEKAKEEERKLEERKKILGDWDDDEEEEKEKEVEEEKKETTADESDEEREEAFMGDDNLHGHFSDDEEEIEELRKKEQEEEDRKKKEKEDEERKKKEEERKKKEEERKQKEKEEKEAKRKKEEALKKKEEDKQVEAESERKEETKENGTTEEPKGEKPKTAVDVEKVLEETSVPELPAVPSKDRRKSVKFSNNLTKEMKQKTVTVMQPESNLVMPMEVEDEFALDVQPSTQKKILKPPSKEKKVEVKTVRLAFKDDLEESLEEEMDAAASVQTKEDKETILTLGGSTTPPKQQPAPPVPSSTLSTTAPVQVIQLGEPAKPKEPTPPVAMVASTTSPASPMQQIVIQAQSPAVAAESEQEETYILVVDDGSGSVDVDQLNHQTLYIDPRSLASGDLSNMVLMTEPTASAVHPPLVSAQAQVSSNGQDILAVALANTDNLVQVVTSVDTKGGVATIPGHVTDVNTTQVQLITTPAQPGPVMSSRKN